MIMQRTKWAAVLLAATFLGGCGLASDPALLTQTVNQRSVDPQGLQKVLTALKAMEGVESYQLKGQIQAGAGRFVRTVNFFGSIQLPSTISMDETIGGSDYVLYQTYNFAYAKNSNKWEPVEPVTGLQPWDSLQKLLAAHPPQVVYQLPPQVVVSWQSNVYQFQTSSRGVPGVNPGLGATSSTDLSHSGLYTVWVDKTDGMVRQIEVQSTVGVPNLGTVSFDSQELFSDFNRPLEIKAPNDLLAQVERP